MKQNYYRKGYYLKLYILISLFSLLLLTCFFYFSKGTFISKWFFHQNDFLDTGMDFFHSIEYVHGREPYAKFETVYPPLANLFFLLILYIIPRDVSFSWPDDYYASIRMRGTALDLRVNQATMICFLVFILICVWLLISLIRYQFKRERQLNQSLLSFCALTSYGVLWCIERGNILFLVLSLCYFFLLFYRSNNKILKETALVSLAIAAGIKLYPAFFGLLLLQEKDWKSVGKAVIYGICFTVLPCFAFKEGLGALRLWLEAMASFQLNQNNLWSGNAFSSMLYAVKEVAYRLFNVTIADRFFSVIGAIVAAIMLASSFLQKKEWQRILCLCLAIMMYSPQGDYTFCLFLLPFFSFLQAEINHDGFTILAYICMMLLILPLPLFRVDYMYYLKVVIKHLCLCGLIFCCLRNGFQRHAMSKS